MPFKIYYRFLMFGAKTFFVFIILIIIVIAKQTFYFFMIAWLGIWAEADDQTDPFYFYIYLIIILAVYSMSILKSFFTGNLIITSSYVLHNIAIKALAFSSSLFYDKNPTGRVLNRFSKDLAITDDLLQIFFTECVNTTSIIIGNFIIISIMIYWNAIPFVFYLLYVY